MFDKKNSAADDDGDCVGDALAKLDNVPFGEDSRVGFTDVDDTTDVLVGGNADVEVLVVIVTLVLVAICRNSTNEEFFDVEIIGSEWSRGGFGGGVRSCVRSY